MYKPNINEKIDYQPKKIQPIENVGFREKGTNNLVVVPGYIFPPNYFPTQKK
tara:strand:+ start:244 stop:399 length:156 start_codon:yes stop_codon:yes gene_type:complete